jgi:hypothetical protein
VPHEIGEGVLARSPGVDVSSRSHGSSSVVRKGLLDTT